MTVFSKTRIAAFVVLLLAAALLLSGCAGTTESEGYKGEVEEIGAAKAEDTACRSTKMGKGTPGVEISQISGTTVGLSFAELAETSTLIVYGKVSRICEPALVEWVGGGSSHITDVEFTVSETLRGECGDTITVRTLGGLVDNVYEEYTDVPELREGEEYLLFLYQPGMGGSMNTRGDYYYLRGLSQGVYVPFSTEEQGSSLQEDPVLINYTEQASSLSVSDMRQRAALDPELQKDASAQAASFSLSKLKKWSGDWNRQHPVNPDYFREAELEAYRFNLENGTITQEEYDLFTAQMDQYAEIVS